MNAKISGNLGENLVIELLKTQGWQILATQWHCCWGELDVVARDRFWLVFIEVKTRNSKNWDANGALAITKTKQKKLLLAAQDFLAAHPQFENLSCRFDVALVKSENNSQIKSRIKSEVNFDTNSNLGNSNLGNSNCQLQSYIQSAFSAEAS